jgi:hypothetical protein
MKMRMEAKKKATIRGVVWFCKGRKTIVCNRVDELKSHVLLLVVKDDGKDNYLDGSGVL